VGSSQREYYGERTPKLPGNDTDGLLGLAGSAIQGCIPRLPASTGSSPRTAWQST